ncbi:TetR family transcriptional regulator [Kribbella amoyensis]|uniref:TetR family transcriptional regulator n=1 Tax=Kribbella amoyensis TaxID=996641 RepID=A0A561BNF8_9ACTN|nr:TetR/AcrR family transcriptional regulator [Kribbella amoyensis]TWD80343.1 TetR family transcriptional regulator [Kribbella amoyensis]
MTDVSDRNPRRPVDKFAERRAQLATSALRTLSELGYARTSLREIAQNSDFSHGVLHYYFRDKVDLITYCVQQYKAECVTRYDQIVATAAAAEPLRQDFAEALTGTCRDDATMHRLWYDLRNQALFEEAFRADVLEIDRSLEQMIWRIASTYADLAGRPLAVTPATAYGLLDGLFQQALLRHLAADPAALDNLRDSVVQTLPRLLAAP